MGPRAHAGHEFPGHVEHILPKDQIEADLFRMKSTASSTTSGMTPTTEIEMEVNMPPSTLRKHSLKDDMMGDEGMPQPKDTDSNPYRLSKIRRKSR
jgi:hypothetical protein